MLYIHSLVPYLGYFNFGIHTGNSLLLYRGMIHIIPCNGLVARNCIEPPPGHCFLSHQRRDEQTEKEVSIKGSVHQISQFIFMTPPYVHNKDRNYFSD
mgnify:CR=1 FL=1